MGQVEGSIHAKNHLDLSSGFDTVLTRDGRTPNDSIYRTSIALSGKNACNNSILCIHCHKRWGKVKFIQDNPINCKRCCIFEVSFHV